MKSQADNMKESVDAARKELRGSESFITASFEGLMKNYKADILQELEHTIDQYWGCCTTDYSSSGEECFNEGLSLALKTIKEVLK